MRTSEGKSIYILPQTFIDQISLLEKNINVPEKTENKYVKCCNDINNDKKIEPQWIKEKTDIVKFKATVIDVKEGLEKDINDIRKSLNMISKKNFDTQKEIVLKFVRDFIDEPDSLIKISVFIFDIASSNLFYGDIYADLYVYFIEESKIFKDILLQNLSLFKTTIENIKHVDSNIDYDGYCNYVKTNDRRRSIASFYMLLVNKKVIDVVEIVDIIVYLQAKLFEYINLEDKKIECEEITELLYILVTMGKSNKLITKHNDWIKIINDVSIVSKYKLGSYRSLSSRVIFKSLDIIDFMLK